MCGTKGRWRGLYFIHGGAVVARNGEKSEEGSILLWRGHRRAFTFWLINGQLLGLPTSTLRCLSREFRDPFVRSSLFKPRGKKSWLDDAALGEARVYEVVRSM